MFKKLPKLIVILGPTASGKTDLAIKLAKKFNGEIISADSRQIYKEMDIGTAKATKKEVEKIPHHLMNIIKPNERFNVAIYKKLAIKAIKNIQKQGELPFLVGGTGLYIKAIVDNINFPQVLPQQKLRKSLEKKSPQELFKIYKKIDPKGAKVIDKKNKRRLIRAIEVCRVSGKSFWEQRKKGAPLFDILEIGIKLPKTELEKKIKKRIEKMFKAGLEKEVRKLVKKYGFNISPMQTIGYQEWKEFFKEKIDKNGVKKRIILHTLQFTKRQMTWFTRQNFVKQNLGGFKKHPAPEQVQYETSKRIHWIKNYKQAENLIKRFLKTKREG